MTDYFAPPEPPTRQEAIKREYALALRALHTANQLAATGSDMDITIAGIEGQIVVLEAQMADLGMAKPHGLDLRGLGESHAG